MNLTNKLFRCPISFSRKLFTFPLLLRHNNILEKSFYPINENSRADEVTPQVTRELNHQSLLKNLSEKFFKLADSKPYATLWIDLENESMKTIEGLNSYNFDGVMMTFLRTRKLYNQAESFFRHVEQTRNPNDATLANFMIVAAEMGDEAAVLEAYRKINKDLLIVPEMQKLVAQAFSKTSLWKESLQLIKFASVVNAQLWIEAAAGAFRNREFKIGAELIEQIINTDCSPNDSVFATWLSLIKSLSNLAQAEWLLNKFLECLRRNQQILSLENALLLKNIFTSTGQCPECHYKLECPHLTPEEHTQLTETLLKHLKQGSYSFEKSNPKELGIFLRFLEGAKPYNIVLDALNVAYRLGLKQPYHMANRLLQVVTTLQEQGYQPLVLGRQHIRSWNRQLMSKLERKVKCFYADNISADDPFMMYAALYGGPTTLILTNDLLRDHAFQLPEDSKGLFQTWRHSIQVYCEDFNGRVVVFHHKKFATRAQGNMSSGWHVPYNKEGFYRFNVPFHKQRLHWLCIHRNYL